MAVFRRRKRSDDEQGPAEDATGSSDHEDFEDDLHPEDRALEDAELLVELERQETHGPRAPLPAPQGPWDMKDAPEPAEGIARLDLGGLQVPVPADTEVRVDMSPEGEVIAATLVQGEAQLQVNAFAAPRTEGIWAEVRSEIRTALDESGGRTEESEGSYGVELHAQVPTEVEGQGVVLAPARFVGIDGPRWFLRALLTGTAATDPAAAAPLEAALRDIVVVRGGDPMAVRDPLPLRLPADVAEQAAAAQQAAEDEDEDEDAGGPVLEMPERGPEITEIR